MAIPLVPTRNADGSLQLPEDDRAAFADENVLFDSDRYKLPSSFVQTAIVEKSREQDESLPKPKSSDTFDGTDPEWNENLSLFYKSKHEKGFTNLELLKNEATLYISVFDNFGSYDKTYGTLGAVIVLLIWIYVGAVAMLLGGLVNRELTRVR